MKRRCGRLAMVAVGFVVSASSAAASPILPTSYDMPNGQTGTFNYWDEIYTGAGSPTTDLSALSGGLGDLTDGVIPAASWSVTELPPGNGPYVGWFIDPLITFHFAPGSTIDSLTIYVDDDPTQCCGVYRPRAVTINGGSEILVPFAAATGPVSFTFSGLNLDSGDPLALQIFLQQAGRGATMLSEVTFDGSSNAASVPEPATMLLLGTGLAGLAARRRLRK